jgi:hypothetical protein
MERRPARKQPLPLKEAAYLNTLNQDDLMARAYELYNAGWTLQAIGDALIPPRPRSTVRSWLLRFQEPDLDALAHPAAIPTPRYQTHADGYQKRRPVSPGIQPDERALIQRIAPIARRFRAKVSSNDSTRVANDQLTAICLRLYYSGVSVTELADAAGVTYRAMVKRLKKR